MEGIVLDKRIEEALMLVEGQTLEEIISSSIMKTLEHRLEECHRRIGGFEAKYGMPFGSFVRAWDKDRIAGKHSAEVESDYIDWEAYEMERRSILRTLGKIKSVVSAN